MASPLSRIAASAALVLAGVAVPVATAQAAAPVAPAPHEFQCQSKGRFGDPDAPHKFYVCRDCGNGVFVRYRFACPGITVWDPAIRGCKGPWDVALEGTAS
ncbi:chitin-binding domain-containing protein [Streptomyces sp. NBC_00631]|uniref:chitin-binding domain-containing protein n=1 Tax=Streptomyces sp. NBC_00631 TaxID=2975793 RepID=UPI00386DC6AB